MSVSEESLRSQAEDAVINLYNAEGQTLFWNHVDGLVDLKEREKMMRRVIAMHEGGLPYE